MLTPCALRRTCEQGEPRRDPERLIGVKRPCRYLMGALALAIATTGGTNHSTRHAVAPRTTAHGSTASIVPPAPLRRFTAGKGWGVSFDHPAAWHEFHYVVTS